MDRLPAECISQILAFTSPKDVCRFAAVSSTFRSAADSDVLWNNFLPADYQEIIAQSSSSSSSSFLNSLSEKALYFYLCDHTLLIGRGNTSFALDKESGRKCYMIGARDLHLMMQTVMSHWTWESVPESRFTQAAQLHFQLWLDIKGKIEAKKLTPKTNYGAFFVFKLVESRHYRHGLSEKPVQLRVYFEGVEVEEGKMVLLDPPEGVPKAHRERTDGWMEIEMGQFFNGPRVDGSIIFRLTEVDQNFAKGGLIVEGIEIRPISIM